MQPAVQRAPEAGIEIFLKQNEEKELLRFSTAGSVDDGKSTLIGRLLFDSKGVYEDQLASIRKAGQKTTSTSASAFDFALLTDGLRAEREQGITIDVAYRYFSTPKRKFIIADTPGHVQYTRNMATGASTANLAIILVDARHGVLPQSRRHAFIASLLGIPHMLVAINKMDLVGYSEEVYESIKQEFGEFAARLQTKDIRFIPISALHGDNVVEKTHNMPWYQGESLLHVLENVHIASDRNLTETRFPVQYVLRPNLDFRGYAGQVASGVLKAGDPVMVLPSGKTSRVKSIVSYEGNLPKAFPPMSVTICLEDEIDISRGDMLVHPQHPPHISRQIDARVVWMNDQPLQVGREYLLKHTTQTVRARVATLRYRVNIETLDKEPASELRLNEIGAAVIDCSRPLFYDAYRRNRATGSFILIDRLTNETVAAGMITARPPREVSSGGILLEGVSYEQSQVTLHERMQRTGHRPATIWLEGDRELAYMLERRLFDLGAFVHVIAATEDNVALAGLARLSNTAGLITICSVETSDEEERRRIEETLTPGTLLRVSRSELPADRLAAVSSICATLYSRGVLQPDS